MQSVRVRTPHPIALVEAVTRAGGVAVGADDGAILVQGLPAASIGDLAYDSGLRIHELAPAQASLEEAFMELTAASVEFRAQMTGTGDGSPAGRSEHVHTTGVA